MSTVAELCLEKSVEIQLNTVPVLVPPEGRLGDARPRAVLALVRLLARVYPHVGLQSVDVHEALSALRTVVFGRTVRLHVFVESTWKGRSK